MELIITKREKKTGQPRNENLDANSDKYVLSDLTVQNQPCKFSGGSIFYSQFGLISDLTTPLKINTPTLCNVDIYLVDCCLARWCVTLLYEIRLVPVNYIEHMLCLPFPYWHPDKTPDIVLNFV